MKIKKGDNVKIITGKDKGKTGKVIKVNPRDNKALIDGLNIYKKHVRPKKQGEKGEIVLVPRPISASNVMIVCSGCGREARIGYRIEGKTKTRICRRCGASLQ